MAKFSRCSDDNFTVYYLFACTEVHQMLGYKGCPGFYNFYLELEIISIFVKKWLLKSLHFGKAKIFGKRVNGKFYVRCPGVGPRFC